MDKKYRKYEGRKPTPIEAVADSIERESSRMPHLRITMDRNKAEALAFVAIRRLRAEDRKHGWRRIKDPMTVPGKRVESAL